MAQTVALNQRLGGTNFLTIDGVSFLLVEISWRVSTPTRESAKGQDGIHGYTEKPEVSGENGSVDFTFESGSVIEA